MRHAHILFSVALVAATVLSGCRSDDQLTQNGTSKASSLTVPSGTSIDITLETRLTSETASIGTAWNGSVRNAVFVDGKTLFPVGSQVAGTVTGVTPARRGDRAMLDLGLNTVSVDGRNHRVHGTTEAVIAGSTRARNLGAIAAGTVAGAIVGKAVSGSTKGTVIGAVVGGGAATGVVSQTKGYQVVLKEGIPLTFTTNEVVAVRL